MTTIETPEQTEARIAQERVQMRQIERMNADPQCASAIGDLHGGR